MAMEFEEMEVKVEDVSSAMEVCGGKKTENGEKEDEDEMESEGMKE